MNISTSPITTLTNIHAHLSSLNDDSPPGKQDLSPHLGHLAKVLSDLRDSSCVLNEINGALTMVLDLLAAAHADRFSADNLHCLMTPLQAKLSSALDQLQRAL